MLRAGDVVLREVAARALRNVRGFDLVVRYGGEEFVVVLPETPTAVALIVAERLRSMIAETAVISQDPAFDGIVTISAGVATTKAGDTPQSLLQRADTALYLAKAKGRNRVINAEEPVVPPSVAALAAT